MIPDPTLDVSQYLFHHPGRRLHLDDRRPEGGRRRQRAGKPCLSVGSGNAPVYVHRERRRGMAVVDMLISKTFDASVICPAEQTCVIDERDLRRRDGRVQADGGTAAQRAETSALARTVVRAMTGASSSSVLGQSCSTLAALAGFEADEADKVLLAPLPTDLDELAPIRSSPRS